MTGISVAFVVTAVAIWLLRDRAPKLGLVQEPDAHRRHESATPIVGGLGMFAGSAIGWWFIANGASMAPLTLAAGAALLLGLADDLRPLSHYTRFAGQIVAAGLMVFAGNVVLLDMGALVSENLLSLDGWSAPVTIFAAVGLMNAVNMSDGMDGLAGSLCLLALACIGSVATFGGDGSAVAFLGPVAGALIAFLAFNLRLGRRRPARVFMGDAGSVFLGLLMAWMFVHASQGEARVITPVTALWLFALPLYDAVGSLIRRPAKGRSPFRADLSHYHHTLRAYGLSVNQVLGVSLLTASGCAGFGLYAWYTEIPERYMFFAFLAGFAAYLVGMEYLARGARGAFDADPPHWAEQRGRRP